MRPFDVSIVNDSSQPLSITTTDPLDVNLVNAAPIEVTIADGLDVNVTNNPLNVSVGNTPSVNATVVGTPSVTISGTPAVTISGTPSVSISGGISTTPLPFGQDGSERLRVGQLTTLMDGKILDADNTRLFQNVGTGTGLYSANLYSMSVTSGKYFIRQSRRFNPYFSGKSQLVEETFDNFQPQVNVVKRVGYFSSNDVAPHDTNKDGFWLESDGTTIRLIMSNNGTETLNVPITSWSGYANLGTYQNLATWQNFTVVAFDFLWLGGAVLRLFIKTTTGFTLAHQFNYSSTAQGMFLLSPNQPMRYEIRSSTGVGSMRYICCQVATEGSNGEAGETLSVANLASVATNVVGTVYALLGIRKATAFRDIAIQIIDMAISNSNPQNDAGVLYLLLNPTLSAPLTYSAKSRLEQAKGAGQTVTVASDEPVCDRIVAALPVGAAGSTNVMSQNFLSYLTSTITNTHDQFVLAYLPITQTQAVNGVITVKEY